MRAVSLEGACKDFGPFRAVDQVNFAVERGEFVTLLGPSGCGKTTTLRLIAGFLRPSAGVVRIDGVEVNNVPPHRRQVGLVFQNYALFPHMTALENVMFGLRMRRVPLADQRKQATEALGLVRLADHGDRYPSQLSGGQQQRVALARALVIKPAVLLLDEPLAALDKKLREHMRAELRTLQSHLKIPTILVTHDQDEALSMSERVAVMHQGRIEQFDRPWEVYENPKSRFVAEFVGRSNLLPARVDARGPEGVVVEAGPLRLHARAGEFAPGARVVAMIRPERVRLDRKHTGAGGIPGHLTGVTYLGAQLTYEVVIGDGTRLEVTLQNTGQEQPTAFAAGTQLFVTIPPEAVYLIPDREGGAVEAVAADRGDQADKTPERGLAP